MHNTQIFPKCVSLSLSSFSFYEYSAYPSLISLPSFIALSLCLWFLDTLFRGPWLVSAGPAQVTSLSGFSDFVIFFCFCFCVGLIGSEILNLKPVVFDLCVSGGVSKIFDLWRMMKRCAVEQGSAYTACEEMIMMMGSVSVVCPKPRRVSLFNNDHISSLRWQMLYVSPFF